MKITDDIWFSALGGGDSIGASCYLIRIGDTSVLIDCGIHPGKPPKDTFEQFLSRASRSGMVEALADINAFILSHAHTDHSGLVPALHKYLAASQPIQSRAAWYTSLPTKHLIPHIFSNTLRFGTDLPFHQGDAELVQDQFREPDVDGLLDWMIPEQGKVKLHPTSHLLGSSMVEVMVNGRTVLYTGDLKTAESPTLKGSTVPNCRPDLLIVDATYAGSSTRRISDWSATRDQLYATLDHDLANEVVVLLPCFALGRTQDILGLVLEYAESRPKLPFYIYVDGQARDVTRRIYPRFRHLLQPRFVQLLDQQGWRIRWVETSQDLDQLLLEEIKGFAAVVIASSGMLKHGSASHRWANALAGSTNFAIVTTGYLDEDAQEEMFGKGTLDRLQGMRGTEALPVSGHSSINETISLIQQLQPSAVLLVHCGSGDLEGEGSLIDHLRSLDITSAVAREEQTFQFTRNGVYQHGYRSRR